MIHEIKLALNDLWFVKTFISFMCIFYFFKCVFSPYYTTIKCVNRIINIILSWIFYHQFTEIV